MKLSFALKLAAALAAVAQFVVPSAQAKVIQGDAVAVTVNGTVDYSLNGGTTWYRLNKNDVLRPGAEVRTDKDGSVDLFLNYNGPALHIEKNSQVVLTKLDREDRGDELVTDTFIKVKSGGVYGYAQKASSGSRYIVENNKGQAFITGTSYYVTADGYVVVTSGSVEVRYARNSTSPLGGAVLVSAGFMFDPTSGLVVPDTSPGNVLATVTATVGNIRRYNLARTAKVEVKAISN